MRKDARYEVAKDIQVKGGSRIPKGTSIYCIHGNFYMDGGLLPKDYQEDFEALVSYEEKTGWNYLTPIKTATPYQNSKSDI